MGACCVSAGGWCQSVACALSGSARPHRDCPVPPPINRSAFRRALEYSPRARHTAGFFLDIGAPAQGYDPLIAAAAKRGSGEARYSRADSMVAQSVAGMMSRMMHGAVAQEAVRVIQRLDCGSPGSASISCSPCRPLRSQIDPLPGPGEFPFGESARRNIVAHPTDSSRVNPFQRGWNMASFVRFPGTSYNRCSHERPHLY